MKRQFFAVFLSVILLFMPIITVHAAPQNNATIITYEDGGYIVIELLQIQTRSSNTIAGQKQIKRYDTNNQLEWQAVLTAQFEYNGQSATCTSANCAVFTVDESWHEVSNVTTRSGGTATTSLVISRKLLGITVKTINETITLTCDKNGNLS